MSLNCINSALFKSHFCFHSIVTIVIICVLWDDKNRTNSKYVLLQFYHFTCIKKKPYKIDFFWPFLSLKLLTWSRVIQTFIKLSFKFPRSRDICLSLMKNVAVTYHFSSLCLQRYISKSKTQWKEKLNCYNDLQSHFSKQILIW